MKLGRRKRPDLYADIPVEEDDDKKEEDEEEMKGTAFCTSHHQTRAKAVEMSFGEEKASQVTRPPATGRSALLVGPVQPLWQELLKKFQLV